LPFEVRRGFVGAPTGVSSGGLVSGAESFSPGFGVERTAGGSGVVSTGGESLSVVAAVGGVEGGVEVVGGGLVGEGLVGGGFVGGGVSSPLQ
jgi:hypothetical protein